MWAKRNWTNVGGRLVPGGYVLFTDSQFAPDGVAIRITGIKDYPIPPPYTPTVELSNGKPGKSLDSALKELESEEAVTDDKFRQAEQFTKRRWRDAKETMGMLDAAWQENFSHFSGSISPLAVQTMMLLVGDESLQFRFVDSKTSLRTVNHGFAYDAARKQFMTGGGIIQHMTLGINTLCPTHDASEYKFWDMEPYASPVLDDPSKGYYLYARCSKTAETGSFMLSEQAVAMDGDTDWHLLAGILNSEYEGERSFVTLYGFTEILPGHITTDKIVSTDGNTYFDLLKGVISGRITFESGSSGLHDLNEWDELNGRIDAAQNDVDAAAESAKDANDAVGDLNEYVDEAFSDGVISEAEAKAIEKYVNTVNNTKAAVEAAYDKLYTNAYLSGTAKTGLLNAKVTLMGSIDDLISAINSAIADGKATAAEKDDVDSKYTTFNSAYADFEAAVEVANKAIQDALKGCSDEAAWQAIEAGAKADAAQRAADSAAEAARDLKSDVEGAFRDGIITETERRRLENDINVVNTTLEKVKATYNEFHGNDYLTGAARTGLETAYSSFIAAALTESIRAAIADDKATDEESKTVNAKYDAFNKAYAAFEAAIEVANKAIQDALKGYAEAAKNELATKLGYESYDAMVEAAEAGKTMVVGGHINTDLIEVDTLLAGKTFTKEMLAEWVKVEKLEAGDLTVTGSSKIAGFTVNGNGLTNTPFDNDAYVIFRNDEHDCFAGIGGNVLPSIIGARGVARFENFDGGNWFNSVDGTNYAVIAGARGARDNVALAVTGGCVAGLALKTLIVGWGESAGTGSKSAAIGRDVGCVLASTEYTYLGNSLIGAFFDLLELPSERHHSSPE